MRQASAAAMPAPTSPAGRFVPMIFPMKREGGLYFEAVTVGVFVDQVGSFAIGLAVAVCLPLAGLTLDPAAPGAHGNTNLGQALYEAACIMCGVAGGATAARLARRSMVAHGLATSFASLVVSTALGVVANQPMFDARGIFFAVIALAAGPLGGWLASLIPMPRSRRVAGIASQRTS